MVNNKSICLFCSLGCGTAFRMNGENVTAIDYDGALCPRGHYNIEYLNHPQRMTEPQIGKRKVSWDEATSFIKNELKIFSKDEVGILISCLASNEDALAATRLAKALGVRNILAAGTASDLEAYEGFKWEVPGAQLATLEDIENSEALLIVGDILTRAPVLSKRINKVKYGKRGNKIMVIDPNRTHTSWFATNHLVCKPGSEAVVLAAMAADEFASAAKGTVIFVPGQHKLRNDIITYYCKRLAAASANKKYIVYYLFGNTLGVNTIIDREAPEHPTYHELLAKIERGEVKSLLMFGEDISAGHTELQKRFRMLKFVAFTGHFESESSAIYDNSVILPQSTQMDAGGSFVLADGRLVKADPVSPGAGEKTIAEICRLIAGAEVNADEAKKVIDRGMIVKKKDESEILAEIEKIVPLGAAPIENITHFGNNHLVKNFFWYRANNG